MREHDRTAAGIRHLVDAVKLGRATDTLLGELQTQAAALKALERRIGEQSGQRAVQVDESRLAGRLASVAAEFRATLKEGAARAAATATRAERPPRAV